MINIKQRLEKDGESGEIMLEAAIVLLMVFTIIFAMFSLGFMYYQKVMVQTIANETTAYVATNYKYPQNDLDSTTIDISNIKQTRKFRSTFAVNTLEGKNRENAVAYAQKRVQQSSFGINGNSKGSVTIDDADFEIVVDNIGRMHVDCTVNVECEVVFGGFLEILGIIDDPTVTFSASSRAEIIDLTGYGGYTNFVRYFSAKLEDKLSNINSICNSIGTVVDIAKKFMS